nr:hypothetical protein [Tanacetum cinerariifolium]
MLLCKQEKAGIQLNAEQADWKDDTDDESDDQELEAHYMYMAKIQEVSLDVVDSGPIFDTEPEQKVQNDDHYDVFAIECQHPEQSEFVHETYLIEQDAHNVIIESVDMNYDSEQIDQNDEDADLAKERELLASLIEKLKCEIDESKNRKKILETSNKDYPDCEVSRDPKTLFHDDLRLEVQGWELFIRENMFSVLGNRGRVNACTAYIVYYLKIKKKFNLTSMILLRMEDFKKNIYGPMPYAMLLTRLFKHILQSNPQSVVPFDRFTFHERIKNPLDIPRKTIKDKGKEWILPRPLRLFHHPMKTKNHLA